MSTLTNFNGVSAIDFFHVITTPAFLSGQIIAGSAQKTAIVGYIWKPTRPTGTFKIRKVHFRTGAVAINAASVVRVSLQDVSLTTGPPYQPDGTQDQTADISGAALTATTWTTTGALSADRTVSQGTPIAVVWEYQTFTAADSVVVSSGIGTLNPDFGLMGAQSLLNTAAWATVALNVGNVVLECDDGTYAFLEGSTPYTALSSVTIANNITARAAGFYFTVSVACVVDRFAILMSIPASADGSFILYDSDGTTVLATWTVDANAVNSTSFRTAIVSGAPVTLLANTGYRFVFVGGTTTAATMPYADVNAAGMLDCLPLGQQCHYTQRDSGGVWTQTTTRRPFGCVGIAGVHDGSNTLIGSRLQAGM